VSTGHLVMSDDISQEWNRPHQSRYARGREKPILKGIPHVRLVLWINPSCEEEIAIEWLKAGAKLERHRQLGA